MSVAFVRFRYGRPVATGTARGVHLRLLLAALWAAVALWVILSYRGSTGASTWAAADLRHALAQRPRIRWRERLAIEQAQTLAGRRCCRSSEPMTS